MTKRRPVLAASLVAALSTLFRSGAATADEKQLCVAASEQAQSLRAAGKLADAREQLAVCARAECPHLVQKDCTQWMGEVLSALPSVVPAAKDRRGHDVVAVRLTVDGRVVTESLDGAPIALDPGGHDLRFETSGSAPIDEHVVLAVGEKNRLVSVTFAAKDDGPAPPSGAERATADGARPTPPPPYAACLLATGGLVALAGALVVDLTATASAHDLRDSCAPGCSQSAVDGVQHRYTIAGVTAGIGGALLVTSAVLFLVRGRAATSSGASAASLTFQPSRGASAASIAF